MLSGNEPPLQSATDHGGMDGEDASMLLNDSPLHDKRLIMTRMVLNNFKSYAGKIEVGPFHKSFTSIVGPNGSGKSNVIDALLFVFGYRAAKMRQPKLSALIHQSQKFPNLDYCAVEVHFVEIIDKPGSAYDIVPNTELIIARTAFMNNTSKYTIDGRASNFTEVTDLLKKRGVDLDHKRFLILQGEVESISQMKPKAANEHEEGLLEYLEDIIGTSSLQTPIENAGRLAEEINEERQQAVTRARVAEKERDALEPGKREAEEFVKQENELARLRNKVYQAGGMQAKAAMEELEAETSKLKKKLDEEREKYAGLQDEIDQAESEHRQLAEEHEKLGKVANEDLKQFATLEKEDIKLRETQKHLRTKIKKLQKQGDAVSFPSALYPISYQHLNRTHLRKGRHEISELEEKIRNAITDLKSLEAEGARLAKDKEKEETVLDTIRDGLRGANALRALVVRKFTKVTIPTGKTEPFQREIEAKQRQLAPLVEKCNEKHSALDVAVSELKMLEEKSGAAKVQEAALTVKAEEAKRLYVAKEAEIQESENRMKKIPMQIQQQQTQIEDLMVQEGRLKDELNQFRQRAEEVRSQLQDAQKQGNVLRKLMKERDAGRIRGIYGRLGDLGVIATKYDVAISTACPRLDEILVESAEVGQECVQFLRDHNLGRASFLLLKQLSVKSEQMAQKETPENAPRLFDLVKPKDPKLAPAFYAVLGDTLVADNLDAANRIAFGGAKRWRVVTFEGQVIDTAGTMSGGGTKVSRGLMGQKFASSAGEASESDIQKIELDKATVELKMKDVLSQRKQLEKSVEDLQTELNRLEVTCQKLKMEKSSIEAQIGDIMKQVQELVVKRPDSGDVARMKQLEYSINKLEKELVTLRKPCQEVEDAVADLQNKILEIGGTKLRAQSSRVEDVVAKIESTNDKITQATVSKSSSEKLIEKTLKANTAAAKELADAEKQLEAVKQEVDAKMDAAAEIKRKADKAQEILDAQKEKILNLITEQKARHASIQKFKRVELDLNNKMEDMSRELQARKKDVLAWQADLAKLSLQKLDFSDEEEDEELPEFSEEELAQFDLRELQKTIAGIEAKLSKAQPNLGVLVEYRNREEEYFARVRDLDEATRRRDAAKAEYEGLRKRRLEEFMKGFTTISHKLKEMYQMITLGGNAELELVDSLDPFSEGILFSVMPPKKSWKNISNLSGGEKVRINFWSIEFRVDGDLDLFPMIYMTKRKTLSSLALVFALHHFKPTPLYVMDEIDAALDFRNVSIVANYIKERTRNAQFVIISLRNNMFELADRLVGIYKTENTTKTVAISPSEIAVMAQ
ncbi:hypothetical protein HDU93_003717 [Gonapodya sp. JEL0774]|nr:hypothetical protein HDU93_003717 [Gonapodya sp. JEL0774]